MVWKGRLQQVQVSLFSSSSRPIGMIMTVEDAGRISPGTRSLIVDFTPFIGSAKGGYEAYSGSDMGAGEKFNLVGKGGKNLIPFVKGFRKFCQRD